VTPYTVGIPVYNVPHRRTRMKSALAFLIALSFLIVAARGATDPASRCTAAKIKAAAKKTNSKLKCHAAAAARAISVDPSCVMRAEEKFIAAWARAEAKGGCPTSLDEATVEGKVDACVADVMSAFRPCGEVDGMCGGVCPPNQSCFAIGVGCRGEPEPCRCHGSTTTCPTTTSTSSTTSTTLP
jgi:hypothetical protein